MALVSQGPTNRSRRLGNPKHHPLTFSFMKLRVTKVHCKKHDETLSVELVTNKYSYQKKTCSNVSNWQVLFFFSQLRRKLKPRKVTICQRSTMRYGSAATSDSFKVGTSREQSGFFASFLAVSTTWYGFRMSLSLGLQETFKHVQND